MSAIPNISNLSNISRLGSVRRPNNKAYLFDGSNDYIAGDTTIGRTGYDLNVAGNVSTGSDADGSYFWLNGNRDHAALTGTRADIGGTGPTLTQAASFTMKARFKIITAQPNNASGIFAYNFGAGIFLENNNPTTGLKCRIREGASIQDVSMGAYSLNTMYDMYLVYDASVQKMYCYYNGTLVNAGGTSVSFSFTDSVNLLLSDNGIGGGNASSCEKYIYHAAIRNVALTQAEIDADIALGNTTKTDSRIVAYYIPENLQYNTQYMTNPNDLSNAAWVKEGTTSVTANTTVAPDGTTTADTVAINGTSYQGIGQISTAISGAALASKTFIIKAFVKVPAGTALFRLHLGQQGVAGTYSSNFTATTVRQEFTYTSTFGASTSGTGVRGLLSNDTGATNPTLEVRNVRVFLTNETLRDESPNIGGYIGWKTNKVFSCWCKPNADFADSATAGMLMYGPRAQLHDRSSTHQVQIRYGDRIGARTSVATLGASFRSRVHVLGVVYLEGGVFKTKIYINGAGIDSDTYTKDAPNSLVNAAGVLWSGRAASDYYSGYIRDPRIYTFTGSFTDADALAIYNGLEPSSAGITKYLHWRPTPGETGTTTIDHAGNSRTGTLNGGVTRPFLSGS